MIFLLSLLISLYLGYLFLLLLLRDNTSINFRLAVNLAFPFSIGAASVLFTVFSISGLPVYSVSGLELVAAIGLSYKLKKDNIQILNLKSLSVSDLFRQDTLFLVLLVGYIYSWLLDAGVFYFDTIKEPHGLWDAWAYWNLKARFISRAPYEWPGLIHQMSSEGFHGDYPLMQSAFVARCWIMSASESVWIPIITSFIFTFCTVGLLSAAVSTFTNSKRGLFCGLVLLATPFYITLGDSQYADLTVGFFMLATLVFYTFSDNYSVNQKWYLIGAGVSASFAAWSKNEGLLFMFCIIISRFLKPNPLQTKLKELKLFVIGALPVMLLLVYYKTFIAQPNDLILARRGSSVDKIMDLERYKFIAQWFYDRISNFGEWVFNPWWIFVLGAMVFGINNRKKIGYGFIMIILMLSGYFCSYVISYIDLSFHLSTSLHRLFFQLFPSFLFLYFLLLKEESKKGD